MIYLSVFSSLLSVGFRVSKQKETGFVGEVFITSKVIGTLQKLKKKTNKLNEKESNFWYFTSVWKSHEKIFWMN